MMVEAKPGLSKRQREGGKWALFVGFLCVYAWAYAFLATILIVGGNTSRIGNAQAQYIDAVYQAATVREGDPASKNSISSQFTQILPQYTDGLVDPLWPWLMLPYSSETPDSLFESGKWVNLILSGSILIVLGLAAARAFSFSGSAAMILMAGFGVILERATYFSADALYYLLVVLAWLCALSLIRHNHLWLYGVFGFLLGVAYLAKALVWPIAVGFLLTSLFQSIASAIGARKGEENDSLWVSTNQMVGFAMMITAFLLVVGPRMSFANTEFGNPFHSYQNYFIWMDSASEASAFQRNYQTREQLDALSIAERPGLVKFVNENGFAAFLERGWAGGLQQLKNSVLVRGGWILIYGMSVFVIIASIHRWTMWKQKEEVWRVRGTSARWMLLFTLLVVGITLFFTGIGNAVVPHNSMTTSLFLPVLLTFIWIAERYRRQMQRSRYSSVVNWAHCVLMILPVIWVSYRIVRNIQTLTETV